VENHPKECIIALVNIDELNRIIFYRITDKRETVEYVSSDIKDLEPITLSMLLCCCSITALLHQQIY